MNESNSYDFDSMVDLIQRLKLEQYVVADLNLEKADIIFVLESPHFDEVKSKFPVAGETGKSMTIHLIDDDVLKNIPLGKLIFDGDVIKYGIMNCCQIPMQKSNYPEDYDTENIFSSFKTIRSTNLKVKNRRDAYTQKIDNILLNNIKKRIQKLNNKKIYACGIMAQYFLKKVGIKFGSLSHPAYNNWSNSKDKLELEKIRKEINEF